MTKRMNGMLSTEIAINEHDMTDYYVSFLNFYGDFAIS